MKTIEQIYAYHGVKPTLSDFNLIKDKLRDINFVDYDSLFEKCKSLERITPKTIIEASLILIADNHTHRPQIEPYCTFSDDFKRFYGDNVLAIVKKKRKELQIDSRVEVFTLLIDEMKKNVKMCECPKCFPLP